MMSKANSCINEGRDILNFLISDNRGLLTSPAWITSMIIVDLPGQHVRLIRRIALAGANIIASYSETIPGDKYYSIDLFDVRALSVQQRESLLSSLRQLGASSEVTEVEIYGTNERGADIALDFIAASRFPLQVLEARISATIADGPGALLILEDYLSHKGFSLSRRKCYYQHAAYYGEPEFVSYIYARLPIEFNPESFDIEELKQKYGFEIDIQWPWLVQDSMDTGSVDTQSKEYAGICMPQIQDQSDNIVSLGNSSWFLNNNRSNTIYRQKGDSVRVASCYDPRC